MTSDAADAASTPPTDVDLEKILADLGRPIAQLLSSLSTAAVQVMRTMLDQAYQRGRHDALLEASMAPGLTIVHNTGEKSEPVLTAQQLERLRRRQSPGSERF